MPELSCNVPVPSSVFSALAEGADGGIAFAAYAWLWTRADTRGLAPADWPTTWLAGRDERAVLRGLAARGLVAPWASTRYSLGAWLPDALLAPPGDRVLAHDFDRPEVWAARWAQLARQRGVLTDERPDLLAALAPRVAVVQITPEAAAPTTGAPATTDVRAVWEAWRGRQARPQACVLGQSAQRTIRGALTEATVDGLLALVEYAYEADEAGPRYWRGQNDQRRTYLGLDNLLVRSKLASRVQLALEWSSRTSSAVTTDGHRTGDNLGPLARFR